VGKRAIKGKIEKPKNARRARDRGVFEILEGLRVLLEMQEQLVLEAMTRLRNRSGRCKDGSADGG